jgi:hypothetical protein
VIRHVVLWKLVAQDPEEKAANAVAIRERLGALVGVVPGLHSVQVLPDLGGTDGNSDVMLISEHEDEAALAGYQVHPAHLEAASFVRSLVQGRAALDAVV